MSDQVCTAKRIDHVCIVVRDIEETVKFYQDVFGAPESQIEEIEDQGVKAVILQLGNTDLELIQPVREGTGVARFLESKGEGMHHIAFEVDDIKGKLDILKERGMRLVDQEPRKGLAGTIAFLHPGSTGSVLLELVQK
jgi:methylmalonyl-CoA/ethylmalonyl-CoA epimerase